MSTARTRRARGVEVDIPGKYLEGGKEAGGQLVDQRLLPRIDEGEVRILMAGDTCQMAIHKKPMGGGLSAVGGNSEYTYYTIDDPKYYKMVQNLYKDIPSLLPVRWALRASRFRCCGRRTTSRRTQRAGISRTTQVTIPRPSTSWASSTARVCRHLDVPGRVRWREDARRRARRRLLRGVQAHGPHGRQSDRDAQKEARRILGGGARFNVRSLHHRLNAKLEAGEVESRSRGENGGSDIANVTGCFPRSTRVIDVGTPRARSCSDRTVRTKTLPRRRPGRCVDRAHATRASCRERSDRARACAVCRVTHVTCVHGQDGLVYHTTCRHRWAQRTGQKIADLKCGLPDTLAYYTAEELEVGFKKRAAFQRV